ncbi:MAG: glutamine amidotransferase [Frankiales bacterium]|nr:glutamine amidotransferase [Frankiales bacterium]
MNADAFTIAVLFPELLGTYGDNGNGLVLRQRLRWRGIDAEVVAVDLAHQVPEHCDLYVLGGGEDAAQAKALEALQRSPGLGRAVARGVPVLAVCAGFQLLGTCLTDLGGTTHAGLGLIDAQTRPMGTRAVGEVRARPEASLGLPPLEGFENHRGGTVLGPAARPLAEVVRGVGNGPAGRGAGCGEGALQGSVVGTYLHGPVLARNPELADLLLGRAVGDALPPLPPKYGP